MLSYKSIKIVLQVLLLSVIAIIPFVKISALYFPFISGKVYGFRLLVCLALFFFVWLLFKKDTKKTEATSTPLHYKNILVAGLFLFFLSQILVSLFGVSPGVSFFSTIERQDGVIQYGFWILYFLMLIFAFKSQKDWKIFFSVFIATALAVSGYAWLNLVNQGRLAGVFGNPSYLAAYLLFAIGFCFIAIERRFFQSKTINVFLWVLALFFGTTIFFTQTRGVYLALAGAVFLFCLLSLFLVRQNKKLAISCAVILAIGIFSVGGLFIAKVTNFVKNSSTLSRVTEITQFWELGSIRERLLNWQIALKSFSDKPIFGYGPENFSVAFNKHYDFRIGRGDAWFDRVHNQFIEPLATGGIVMFSFYIFLLCSVFYTIFKIAKKEKVLSFILASTFLAYIIQGMFLFDTLPVYLGLFPFLAFIVYMRRTDNLSAQGGPRPAGWACGVQKIILVTTAIVCLFGIQTTVFLPYKASASAIQFMAYTNQGYYKEAMPFAQKTFEINSPYTSWELRKRIGWQFLDVIDGDSKFTEQEVKDVGMLYDFIVPELEKFLQARPYDPQMYYVLPRIYRIGYQKLDKNDLQKAHDLLQQAFKYSDLRVEYYNEMAQVLLLQDKFVEGDDLLKDYIGKVKSFDYFPSWLLGHYYYVAGKYDLAMENYKTAKEKGYKFYETGGEYSRYLATAVETKEYQEVVDMATKYLEVVGPNADTYFNIALANYYLQNKKEALDYFLKAMELNPEQYQQYAHFFGL